MVQENLTTHMTMSLPVDQRLLVFIASLHLTEYLHSVEAKWELPALQLSYLVETFARLPLFCLREISHFPTIEQFLRNHVPIPMKEFSLQADISPSFPTSCSLWSLPWACLHEKADVQRHWIKRRQQGTAENIKWLPSLIPVSLTRSMLGEGWEMSTESILTPQNTMLCFGCCLRLLLTQNCLPISFTTLPARNPVLFLEPQPRPPLWWTWADCSLLMFVIKIFILMQLYSSNTIVLEIE